MKRVEEELCFECNGSGEGMHDGTTCRRCRGRGSVPIEVEDEDDEDEEDEDE